MLLTGIRTENDSILTSQLFYYRNLNHYKNKIKKLTTKPDNKIKYIKETPTQ